MITPELIQKLSVSGPRYTSYPTAPQWTDQFDISDLNQQSISDPLSLYIHIPFCKSMCYYCGCNVLIRKNNDKFADEYISYLAKEMALTTNQFQKKPHLKQFHLGGGTPNFLTATQLSLLFETIQSYFTIDTDCEVAIELDPRVINLSQIKMIKKLGFNRLSMGIQDFDPNTQKAINRIQPYEQVYNLMKTLRKLDFKAINMDLIYGLPHQTPTTFEDTIKKVISLSPDRIALYSYAHVPWLKSHQSLIKPEDLPSDQDKLAIFIQSRSQFLEHGYTAIAMDHFAKKEDTLSLATKNGLLHRNFMGYTTKEATHFLGLGVTAIGFINNCFIQNTGNLKDYYQTLDQKKLPITKGLKLSKDDQIRQWVINTIMCQLKLDKPDFLSKFNLKFDDYFKEEKNHLTKCLSDNLITETEKDITVTDLGKFFMRNICMGFDAYLKQDKEQRYSRTI